MKQTLALLLFLMFFEYSMSVKCYQCPGAHEGDGALCKNFDSSARFVTDCDKSTMCHKRETTLTIDGITSVSIRRDCAPQILAGDQRKVNGKWQPVNDILEVYEEDCKEDRSDPDRATRILNCYCRGDYCNDSTTTALNINIPIYLVLFIYLFR